MQMNNQNQTNQQQNNPLQIVSRDIYALEQSFNELAHSMNLKFKSEALFAIQALQKNDYTMKIAIQNPQSLKNAILNVASLGLSLNPAERQAYIVPRKGAICLDVGYIGFVDLAVSSGALKYVVSKVVHRNDTFELNGLGTEPTHKYEPFSGRGEVIGVYVVAVTPQNTYLVEHMSLEECHAIRDRSETWKAKPNTGAWATDEGEMLKKTVIKKAAKLWPKAPKDNRLAEAFRVVNEHDGIDFEAERNAEASAKEALRLEARAKQDQEREDKNELMNVTIKNLCSELTVGMTAQDKGKFMREQLGVTSYDRLQYLSIDDLKQLVQNLEGMKGESIIDYIQAEPKEVKNYADGL